MDQIDSAEQEVLRGEKAQQILGNDLYIEMTIAIRADLFDKFTNTNVGEKGSSDREELFLQLKAFDRMQSYFESVLQTGKLGTETISLLTQQETIGL